MLLRQRPRRSRNYDFSRRLMAENHLLVDDLIYPLFIQDSSSIDPIGTLPDIYRHSLKSMLNQVNKASDLNIPAVALFACIDKQLKDEKGTEAFNPYGLIPKAVQLIKQKFPHMGVIVDVALDPYTSHGHDGLIDQNFNVLNDQTVIALTKQALVLADSGCDVIAPSDMMDGRIGVIRDALEQKNFNNCLIMSYAAKYASHFYGPFRDAVGSKLKSKNNQNKSVDKRSYQMDYHNADEAIDEVKLDIDQGADWLLIKPGIIYLDILYQIKQIFAKPTFSYQVSGEYAMLKFADQAKALKFENALMESLIAFKRAGADGILTYGAIEAAQILQNK